MSSPNESTAETSTPPMLQRRQAWSLRQTLTVSYVSLVTLVVFGFGISLLGMSVWATYRQAEADLFGAAQVLVQHLADNHDAKTLAITETYLHRFGKAPRDHAYFAVWDSSGKQIAATNESPSHVVPATQTPPVRGPRPFLTRTSGRFLDVIVAMPDGGQLLIGRPLAKEYDALAWLLVRLLLVGLVCILAGCLGAWWLARRISQPIARMAGTAERITSRSLNQRLDVSGTPEEIGRLGGVINTMLAGLQASFERQIRFTADASHELRTPVAIVLSQAEHTLYKERTSEQYREALTTCLQSAKRMKTLVDNLLLLARVDSGRLELRSEEFDLSGVVQDAVSTLESFADTNGVRLHVDAQPTRLHGDAARLGLVVTNLVTNAIKYNIPGGEVWISVTRTPEMAQLVVRDNGIGIPLADHPRVFDRFYRVDRARTQDDETGTGLGLSLVAEIVAAHQGTIQMQSAPDEGTTMTVLIPIKSSRDVSSINRVGNAPRVNGS